MFSMSRDFTEKRIFDWKDLNRAVGRIVTIEPTESCIAEGDFLMQVWFVTQDRIMYLLEENDIRDIKELKWQLRGFNDWSEKSRNN